MTLRHVHPRSSVLPLVAVLAFPAGLAAQQDKVAALKQSLAANENLQKQYKWVETTVISLKGEEKSRAQKQCYYGPDGQVQKQQLTAPPQQAAPGGMKGKAVAKKKEEITATMKQAVTLMQSYVPPDLQRIQSAKAAGKLAIVPAGPNAFRLDVRDYAKSGDSLSLSLDTGRNAIQTISVKSYLESPSDAVALDVTFARLSGGLSYPGNIVLNVPSQQIRVAIQNSNYVRAGAPASTGGASTAAIDTLTAPIALYPDALIAQILAAAVDFAALQQLSAWMAKNASLKGSELQDAAAKAGFAPCYIALTPFPQVVQMMIDKPDWTKQLGKAFTTDQTAVLDSIQRLRVQAQALGNLKTTPQQEVATETTSTGQQVIVISPANPQVIYVPVYNTQTVYVQQAPPPSSSSSDAAAAALVGFTVGIMIGASSNDYYYGGWRGGRYAYNEAWERREDYYEDRQEYAEDRQENARENQDQRQSTAQSNQTQRQTTAQSTAQSNQTQRQTTAQSSASSYTGSGQASQRSGGSGGSSGYQSGGSTRAQSARGSSSRSASRGGGGRRR